jgi:hypothetical protein
MASGLTTYKMVTVCKFIKIKRESKVNGKPEKSLDSED